MKKIFLVILILILVSVFVEARGILDIAQKWTNFSVNPSTSTSTEIRASKSNRKDVILYNNGGYTVYLTTGSYSVAVSTTNGFPLISGSSLSFEDYIGPIYGVTFGTNVPVNIRGIETE